MMDWWWRLESSIPSLSCHKSRSIIKVTRANKLLTCLGRKWMRRSANSITTQLLLFWLIIVCNANTEYFGRHSQVTRDMTSQFYSCMRCVTGRPRLNDIIDRENNRARCTSWKDFSYFSNISVSRRSRCTFSLRSLSLSRNVSAKSSRFPIQHLSRSTMQPLSNVIIFINADILFTCHLVIELGVPVQPNRIMNTS